MPVYQAVYLALQPNTRVISKPPESVSSSKCVRTLYPGDDVDSEHQDKLSSWAQTWAFCSHQNIHKGNLAI